MAIGVGVKSLLWLYVSTMPLFYEELSRDTQKLIIHVFGDSHSRSFEGYPHTYVHWLGPWTMHRVGRDGINGLNVRNYGVHEGNLVMYVFGEIDIRVHIGKQRDLQKRLLDEIIQELINSYIVTILKNSAQFNSLINLVVCPIPPSNAGFNPEFPYYGSLGDRIAITKRFNELLIEACIKNNIYFLNVFDDFANPQGSLRPELSDNSVHIGQPYRYIVTQKLDAIIQGILTTAK